MARWMKIAVSGPFIEWHMLLQDRQYDVLRAQHDTARVSASQGLAQLTTECQSLSTETTEKSREIARLRLRCQTLDEQVGGLEEQNMLNWTRWTETRRTADEQAEYLIAVRNVESNKLVLVFSFLQFAHVLTLASSN